MHHRRTHSSAPKQTPAQPGLGAGRSARKMGVSLGKRSRGVQRNERAPFAPPEDWHEPVENRKRYRIVAQPAGEGFRHVLSVSELKARLAELPAFMTESLEVVQLSRMTRKKQSFPCYGMQWGTAIYLYPIESDLVEYSTQPPSPAQINEARMFGVEWQQHRAGLWKLAWTEEAIKDFYLNNILIHELGHLVDNRNTKYNDRERFAEWFAIAHGYKPSRRKEIAVKAAQRVVRRHHSK